MGARIPAICESCGALFVTENLIGVGGERSARISFVNSSIGPCPNCGGSGKIPDGLYEVSENLVRLLGGPAVSVRDLLRLRTILQVAGAAGAPDPGKVADEIEREVPSAAGIRALLSQAGTPLAQWLAVVIAVISLLLSRCENDQKPTLSPEQMDQLVEEAFERATASTTTTAQPQKFKVGRNEACPCGSGTKFKFCHGR